MAMMKRRLTDLMLGLSDETGLELEDLMEKWSGCCATCAENGEPVLWADFYDMVLDGDL